jgi:alkanesulfonate monooxygenase SsuD/methylene tetrahydromethanopterin reductase-like flavin-dependent oxidoreductase (luciferase family)
MAHGALDADNRASPAAGLRRVARLGDGWLASAYNTTPDAFAAAREQLANELEARGRQSRDFPNGLATMWAWVTEDRSEHDRVLGDVLGPLLRRDVEELEGRLCIGSAEDCAALLSAYARAGCERVCLWPLGEEAAGRARGPRSGPADRGLVAEGTSATPRPFHRPSAPSSAG